MALSYVQYEGDGQTETFPIPFPYIDKSHIEVRVALDIHAYTWDDDQTIRITPAPAPGAVVEARRITPRDNRMVDFVDGSVMTESDLDLSAIQTFYIVQEAIDIAGGTLELLSDGSFGAGGRRIQEVGTPVAARDVVTKEYHDGTWIPQMNAILTAATNEKDAAVTARQAAESARNAAQASQSAAKTSETNAKTSETNAATSASNAAASASTASTKATEASGSASTAGTHRTAAETAKTAAETARDVALGYRNEAQGFRNEAETFKNQAAQSAADARVYDPYAILPIGGIIMWSGSIASIPTNWRLCDGQNGTPDLRDRFIVGAGNTYPVGATGGADTVTLSASQIPSHSHSFSGSTSSNGDHSHSASTGSAGSHNHDASSAAYSSVDGVSGDYHIRVGSSSTGRFTADPSITIASDGAHTHTVSIGTAGAHTHTFSGTTGAAGSGQAHENRPPYYALAYIMRVA